MPVRESPEFSLRGVERVQTVTAYIERLPHQIGHVDFAQRGGEILLGNRECRLNDCADELRLRQRRQWPEGFEFPACDVCNGGSRDDDLLVAMLAKMDPFENKRDRDGRTPGYMKRAHKRYPDMFAKALTIGDDGEPQATGNGTSQTKCVMRLAYWRVSRPRASIYLRTGAIFPNAGGLVMTWFTNADVMHDGRYKLFDILKHIAGDTPLQVRSGKFLNDQFEYKF